MSDDFTIFVRPPTEKELLENAKPDVATSQVDRGLLPQEDAPMAVTGEVDVVPLRNQPGYEEPFGLPKNVMQIKRGGYGAIANMLDYFVNAVPEALEYTGLAKDLPRNYVDRLINAEDYEKLEEVLGGVITYGAGRKGGTQGDTTTEKILRSVGEGLGYTSPFYFTLARSAKIADTLGELDVPAKTVYQAVKKSLRAPYATAPGATAKAEFGMGGVSGLGVGIEQEIVGTNTGLGAMLPIYPLGAAYLASGLYNKIKNVAPVAKAGKFVAEKGGTMVDDLSIKAGADPLSGGRATRERKFLQESIEDALQSPITAERFARTQEIEAELLSSPSNIGRTEVPFTPAEATGDPSLLKTQTRIETEAKADPDFVRKNVERKYDVLGTIENFKRDTIFGGKVDEIPDAPLFILDRVKGRYDSTIKRIDEAADDIADQLDILSSPTQGVIPKITSRKAAGENIRGVIQTYYDDLVKTTNDYAIQLGIKDNTNMGSIAQAKQNIRDSILTKGGDEALSFEGLHPMIKRFMNYSKDEIDFQDWKNFSQQTSQALNKEVARKSGENIRVLKILKEELDNVLDQGQFGADIADSMQMFNAFYKKNLGAINDNSAIKKVIAGVSGGTDQPVRYTMQGEAVADEFLKSSKTVESLLKVTKNDESVITDLRAAMLDKMRDASMKKGLIDPDRLNKFINTNRDILQEIPGTKGGNLYDEFTLGKEGTANVISALNRRQNTLATRKKKIEQNQLFRKISKVYADDNPTKLVDDALKNKGLMKDLKTKLKIKEGSDEEVTFNALIGSRLFANQQPLTNPSAFKNYLNTPENAEIIKAAMGDKHYKNLQTIADSYETILRGAPIETLAGDIAPTGTMEAIALSTGTSVPSIQARIIAVAEGRISRFTAAAYLASRLLSKNQSNRADAIFKEAMFDPKLSKILSTEGGVENGKVTFSRGFDPQFFQAYLAYIGLGADFGDELIQGEKQQIVFEPRSPQEKMKDTYVPPPPVKKERTPPVPITPEMLKDSKVNTPPTPPTAQTGIGTTDVASLFPNDATAMAIARRRAPSGGIATV